jgi:hypothetical protein
MPNAWRRCSRRSGIDFENVIFTADLRVSRRLRAVSLPGGHHFGGDYDRVAALILEHLR